ncbi:MAG: biotin transporter BioY [Alphaproteobacteria bacterium]|nr:biotin transporter BioY [Alphaproteobacteria bacterium]
MSNAIDTQPTLAQTVWQADGAARWMRNVILVLAGTAIMAISAKINVPMLPVPMTMQTFAVLAIGMAYGWRLAGATMVAYLAEGAMGLPVFAGGGGLAYMAGPTGGYLLGFVVSAIIVGWMAERGWDRNMLSTFAANIIGTVVIFGLGFLWLIQVIAVAKGMDVAAAMPIALASGVLPFILGGIVKSALAAAVLPLSWKILGKVRG